MKYILIAFLITMLAGCNDSAVVKRPVKDNVVVKDTAIKDTTLIK